MILKAQVDILLYMALPTEKFTVLLSQHRLVPIQICFGIGHPLSSGSPSMDYIVLSTTMMTDIDNYHPLTNSIGISSSSFAYHCSSQLFTYFSSNNLSISTIQTYEDYSMFKENLSSSYSYFSLLDYLNNNITPGCVSIGPLGNVYIEQSILLESPGFYIEDPHEFYPSLHNFTHV